MATHSSLFQNLELFPDTKLDPNGPDWVGLNRKYSEYHDWPVLTMQKDALPDADLFNLKKGYTGPSKLIDLIELAGRGDQ